MKHNAILFLVLLVCMVLLVSLAGWNLEAFAVGIIGVALGLFVGNHFRHRRERLGVLQEWRQFADEHGFLGRDFTVGRVPTIWGTWKGLTVTVGVTRIGQDTTDETDVVAWFAKPLPAQFIMFEGHEAQNEPGQMPGDAVHLADAELDQRVQVRSTHADAVVYLFDDASVRQATRRALERFDHMTVSADSVALVLRGVIAHAEAIAAYLDDVTSLAHALLQRSAAPEFPAPGEKPLGRITDFLRLLARMSQPEIANEALGDIVRAHMGRAYTLPVVTQRFVPPEGYAPPAGLFAVEVRVFGRERDVLAVVPEAYREHFAAERFEVPVRVLARLADWDAERAQMVLHVAEVSETSHHYTAVPRMAER